MPSVYRGPKCRQQVREWCLEQFGESGVPHHRRGISTGAGTTSVVTAGPDPAAASPSVVLVPGTNTNGAVYRHVAEALAARWPTVVLDVPGQPGLSADARPRRGRSVWYGRWLTEALEQAVPGKALVVGHSLGGAITLASASPRIVGRVVLSSAGLVRLLVPPAVVAATVPWLVRPTVPRAARVLGHMVAPGGRVPDVLAEWMALAARCCHSSFAPPRCRRGYWPSGGLCRAWWPRDGTTSSCRRGVWGLLHSGTWAPGCTSWRARGICSWTRRLTRSSRWSSRPWPHCAGMPHRLRMFPFDDLARGVGSVRRWDLGRTGKMRSRPCAHVTWRWNTSR
ncbi:alpha/beta fold hydrolase [Streptomyces chiangmaiensis]